MYELPIKKTILDFNLHKYKSHTYLILLVIDVNKFGNSYLKHICFS